MSWRERLRDRLREKRESLPEVSGLQVLFFVAVVIGLLVGAAAGGVFQSNVQTSGTVPLETNGDLTVNVSGASNMSGTKFVNDSTLRIATDQGAANFSSDNPSGANVSATNLTGTWTNVTNLNATTELTIDPDDKRPASVSGDVDAFAFRDDISVTDDKADFVYSGTSGTTTVTVNGVAPGVRIVAKDGSGTILGSATSSSDGSVTISGMSNSEHVVTLSAESGPYVKTASPDDAYFKSRGVALNATVVDPEGDDFKQVRIQTRTSGSWTTVATETGLPSGEEINASVTGHPGENRWRVIMNATGNRDKTSRNYTWYTPGQITVYNGTSETKLTQTTVSAELVSTTSDYAGSLSTATGVADLTDAKPPDEILRSEWSAAGVDNQSLVIGDPAQNGTVVLYESTASGTYQQCFSVDDPTGTFTEGNSWAVVEQRITGTWTAVGSERFGVENEATIVLEDGEDYRVRLRNDDGDLRVLGGFTGDSTNNCVPLSVQSAVDDLDDPATVNYNATCTQTDPKRVKFEYNDTADKTDEIYLTVYEYQNESNVLVPNTTFTGTFGTFSYTANVPQDENETDWVVDGIGARSNTEDVQIRDPVCGNENVLPSLPPWLVSFAFVGLIWTVAGLFSQLNGAIGGLVVAGLGAMFWFAGLAPGFLGGGVVALSMATAGILFVRERRGGL